MTKEEIEKLKQARQERAQKLQAQSGVVNPNPASMIIKWYQTVEKAKLEGGSEIEIPSGAFGFYKKNEDGTGKTIHIPKDKFELAIIDHSLIYFQGADMDASGRKVVRSYWSNEMRQSDSFTTPFILKIKDANGNIETHIGSRKELKERFQLKAAVHVVYGLTMKGEIVKLQLPWYSYSKGSDKFKTHGDTLMDSNEKFNNGFMSKWLSYDGFHQLTTGTSKYTAPKFIFKDEFNDEMIVLLDQESNKFDEWYELYHQSNLKFIDNGGVTKEEGYQGEAKEGTDSQEPPKSTQGIPEEAPWVDEDPDNMIPF